MTGEIFSVESFMLSCLWQSTIFLVAGLSGSLLLRRHSARAHRVLLLAMIAAVIVPAASTLVKHYELGLFIAEPAVIQPPTENRTIQEATGIISNEAIEHGPTPINQDLHTATAVSGVVQFPWRSALLYAWIAASLILAARLLVTFALGIRLLGRAMPLECRRIEQAVHLAKAKLGINKDVMVYSSNGVRSPVIWCWRCRPVLLVPSAAGRSENGIDWTGVLCHELAHYKRRDHAAGLLAELAVCILPWHPFLWWAKSRLISLCEQACDDWVVASGQPGTDYAESLLNLIPKGQMAFVPAVVSSKRGLAGRVRRILKDSCGNPRAGGAWAWVVSIVAIGLAIGVALAQTRPAEPFLEGEANGNIEQARHHEREQTPLHPIGMEGHAAVTTSDMSRLIAALSSIEWSGEREHAAITISRIGAGAQAAIPALIERLEDEKWHVRRAAATALTSMGPTAGPAVPALTKALTDEEWQVRRVAAEALASIGTASKPAVSVLIELLGDEEWQARRAATEALAAIGPASASAVPPLIVALDDVEWQVRRRAAEALASIGTASKPATPRLVAALNDEEWQVRRPAALALGAIGPAAAKAIPTLIKRLDDPEWQVRYAVTDALEKISAGDKSSVPEIIEVLLDQEWKKRQSTAQALQKSLQEDKL